MSEANKIICAFIYKNWIENYKSQRSFALDHGIEESIVRKIKNTILQSDKVNYSIPVNTLQKICDAKSMTLSDFFKLLDL
ncbi:MAG: transcriptional regulator [Flavobacterium sp.]